MRLLRSQERGGGDGGSDLRMAPACVSLGVEAFLPVGTPIVAPAGCTVVMANAARGVVVLRPETTPPAAAYETTSAASGIRGEAATAATGALGKATTAMVTPPEGLEIHVSGLAPDAALLLLLAQLHRSDAEQGGAITIAAGSRIGTVCTPAPGSLLPSHVRLQVVAAPGLGSEAPGFGANAPGLGSEAPGACTVAEARAWLRLCPCPAALLGLPASAVQHPLSQQPYNDGGIGSCASSPGDNAHQRDLSDGSPVGQEAGTNAALALRRRNVAGVQEHYFEHPPQFERGWKARLYDTNGRPYLDMVNNVAVLGHCHAGVSRAAATQMQLLNTNSRFVYSALGAFAAKIVATMPASSGLDQVREREGGECGEIHHQAGILTTPAPPLIPASPPPPLSLTGPVRQLWVRGNGPCHASRPHLYWPPRRCLPGGCVPRRDNSLR